MNIAPIETERDYRNALKEIEGLMTARRNTPEGDRLNALVTLVEAWERQHYRFAYFTSFCTSRCIRGSGGRGMPRRRGNL